MIGILVKSTAAFCASYILMSFQINNTTVFEHINSVAGPVGSNIQKALGQSFSQTWDKTKDMGEKLIRNSDPKEAVEDAVVKTQSALGKSETTKKIRVKKPAESYLEELKKEERDGLSKLIESEI